MTKTQRKKIVDFKGRLSYATPKIIAICLEIRSIVQTNDIDLLATVLIYLKQKKLNVIDEILKKFDVMPDDFNSNAFAAPGGIHKAGNYAVRMM